MEKVNSSSPGVLEFRYRARFGWPWTVIFGLFGLALFLYWADMNSVQVVCEGPKQASASVGIPRTREEAKMGAPSALVANLAEGVCTFEWPMLIFPAVRKVPFLHFRDAYAKQVTYESILKANVIDVFGFFQIPWISVSRREWANYDRTVPRWQLVVVISDHDSDVGAEHVVFHDFGFGTEAEEAAKKAVEPLKQFVQQVKVRRSSAEWNEWRKVIMHRMKEKAALEQKYAAYGYFGKLYYRIMSTYFWSEDDSSKVPKTSVPTQREKTVDAPPLFLRFELDVSPLEEIALIVVCFVLVVVVLFSYRREWVRLDMETMSLTVWRYNVLGFSIRKIVLDLMNIHDVQEYRRRRLRISTSFQGIRQISSETEFGIVIHARSIHYLFDALSGVDKDGVESLWNDPKDDEDWDQEIEEEKEKEREHFRRTGPLKTFLLMCGETQPASAHKSVTDAVTAILEFVNHVKRLREQNTLTALEDFKRRSSSVAEKPADLLGFSVADHIKELQREVAVRSLSISAPAGMPSPRVFPTVATPRGLVVPDLDVSSPRARAASSTSLPSVSSPRSQSPLNMPLAHSPSSPLHMTVNPPRVSVSSPRGSVALNSPRGSVALNSPRGAVALNSPRGSVALNSPRGLSSPRAPASIRSSGPATPRSTRISVVTASSVASSNSDYSSSHTTETETETETDDQSPAS